MKTLRITPETEEALAAMSDAEAGTLFRSLVRNARPTRRREKENKEQEKEKNQKNKEIENKEQKNNNLILKGENEWQKHFRQLCQDMDYLEHFRQQEDLTREQMRQYLKVFAHNLQERYTQHHWQNHGEFRRHFLNWYRLPINSQSNIAQQYTDLTNQETARRRKALREQQEQAARLRQEQEWEEHKKRAVPCPETFGLGI